MPAENVLLHQLTEGSEKAFEQLYDLWYDKVYGTALLVSKSPDLASDIAQDVFLLLWRDRAKFATVDNLGSFLFVTTRNMVYNKLKRLNFEEAYKSYILPQPSADMMDDLRLKEMQQMLEDGIRQLPPQQQRAFRLSREQGLSHEEIARQMGISQLTVKDYIVKALAFLRTYLKGKGELFMLFLYWVLSGN